jgi:hypothetical protein
MTRYRVRDLRQVGADGDKDDADDERGSAQPGGERARVRDRKVARRERGRKAD